MDKIYEALSYHILHQIFDGFQHKDATSITNYYSFFRKVLSWESKTWIQFFFCFAYKKKAYFPVLFTSREMAVWNIMCVVDDK